MAWEQLDLPFQRHSETSRAAALAAEPAAASMRGRVLAALRQAGPAGLTDDEMQVRLAMNPSTQRPRRVELARAGLVVETDRTRETRGGRAASVWVAAEHAADGGANDGTGIADPAQEILVAGRPPTDAQGACAGASGADVVGVV